MPPGKALPVLSLNVCTHRGVIVPMVTPLTAAGRIDTSAVQRIVDYLHCGGVHGVFVLGTTGEGPFVPEQMRAEVVRSTVESVNGRMLVYAGISSESIEASIAAGNNYLAMGVHAVVAHAPSRLEHRPDDAMEFFREMVSRLDGDLILYNMPLTTRVSLPIEICKATANRPRVIGIKDSENNPARMAELLEALGKKDDFSIFIGTGPLMGQGLLMGAEGIVPSAGNLAPALCRELYEAAARNDQAGTDRVHKQLMQVSAVYQKGRDLPQSIAALKGAMSCLDLCGPTTFPPLEPLSKTEIEILAKDLAPLGLNTTTLTGHEGKRLDSAHNG